MRTPLLRRLFGLAIVVGAVGATAGCGESPPEEPPVSDIHVVCVLVDQLRKDSADAWMPRVNELASRGVVFEQMRSVAPWTYPSVLSLMSGLYPQQHGATGHMVRKDLLATFDEQVPLVQETLQDGGYRTAAFITNPFLLTWNSFYTGFDTFDVHFINSQGNLRGLGKHVWTEKMFADEVNASIRAHFDDEELRGPEFTYIHYIDVHGPWEGAPFEGDYESSIRWMDERIVEMYEYFLDRYDGNVLFFVTSDHGMALGDDVHVGDGDEHRRSKATVHDFNLRIPFVVLPSAHVTAPQAVTQSTSNVDFVPTLLDWLGVPLRYPSPGVSLMPAIRGEPLDLSERPVYARMEAFKKYNDCLVHEGRKYMRSFHPRKRVLETSQVFDLADDPRETRSLGDDFGDVIALLNETTALKPSFRSRFDAVESDVLEDLQALGYLGGK